MPYNVKMDWKQDDPVTEVDINRWEQGIADAHVIIDIVQPMVLNHETRIKALESSLANDLRDNLFSFDFSSTVGLNIEAGWVDQANAQLVMK
ncbi:hypothetical protein [Brevibacillus parabrevis]|uniref:hypothetical protein n=1 Tax=Brevibacillus parabrevis TaxID=54914 RepID=UPI002E1D1351|nr:hypothetical protein [Brevibacillus parabrevis]